MLSARATMWSVLNEGYLMTLWTSGRRPYTVTLSLQTAMPLEQFPIPLAALPKVFGLEKYSASSCQQSQPSTKGSTAAMSSVVNAVVSYAERA